ncbi:MAG: hypothetical protein V4493_11415 [Pseudomonadota bacterium]
MKTILKKIAYLSIAALLSAATGAYASESKTNTLLYISPNDYNYSVHLLHPYYDYWFEQGPLVEPIALNALKAKDSESALCKANETANTIIRVKPSVFYNPQLRVYHSKLVATVYSGGGNVLGTYVGEAQQLGANSVDNGITYSLNKVYTLAMQDLMTKLKIDTVTGGASHETKLPCGLIGAQAETKVNFY